jgi:hypothetical protein
VRLILTAHLNNSPSNKKARRYLKNERRASYRTGLSILFFQRGGNLQEIATMQDHHANLNAITRFLAELSNPWGPHNHFHFRFLREDHTVSISNFAPHDVDAMIAHIIKMNETHNVYVVANPVPDNAPRVPHDKDIKCAHFAFIDADDGEQTRRAREFTAFAPYMETITGTKPSERIHRWYKFDQPMTDLDKWSELQKRLASNMQTDRTVFNKSQLMRVAGTISYPSQTKIKRKYTIEATRLFVGGSHVA